MRTIDKSGRTRIARFSAQIGPIRQPGEFLTDMSRGFLNVVFQHHLLLFCNRTGNLPQFFRDTRTLHKKCEKQRLSCRERIPTRASHAASSINSFACSRILMGATNSLNARQANGEEMELCWPQVRIKYAAAVCETDHQLRDPPATGSNSTMTDTSDIRETRNTADRFNQPAELDFQKSPEFRAVA